MATTGQRLSDALDGIEDHILDGRPRDDRRRLGPVRRNAVRLHRQIAGLAAVFHRLEADGATDDVHGPAVAAAARLAQRLDALDHDMTLQAERARLLQEEVSERNAEATNRQLYVVSVLSALFLPPTFVIGLFGMNVKGLPLGDDPHGFLAVCGLGLASAVLAFAVIRVLGIRPPGLEQAFGDRSDRHRTVRRLLPHLIFEASGGLNLFNSGSSEPRRPGPPPREP